MRSTRSDVEEAHTLFPDLETVLGLGLDVDHRPRPAAPLAHGEAALEDVDHLVPVVLRHILLGLLAGAPLFAGVSFLKRRDRAKEEIVVFEARALDTYRALRGPTVTKDTLVRDHGFTPEDADRTLGWLAGQELLEADWTDMDGPLTYKRND